MEHARLRETLVSELQQAGTLQDPAVARAFGTVPRHRFIPEVAAEEAYADRAISIKHADGETVASISQPSMLARMLDLAAVRSGDRVLEIGTGSGYNAALLAELAGANGLVITVEVEPDLVQRARVALDACGYEAVRVVLGDGHDGFAAEAPYDRIVVSASANDIPVAWWQQLENGGRIVVPLDIGIGGEYAAGFTRNGNELRSIGIVPCLFVALRGERRAAPAENVFLRARQVRYGAEARPVKSIVAVPTSDASSALLEQADVVVAQTQTTFAVTLAN
ncbi:MAG: protein-L-isoaspartate O-methyltransferase [Candidatus Tyrphobacter sp.]